MARKAHLLLVDDDPNTLASLSRAFRLAGHEATVCDNAARAVELIRTESFDVILSDVVMPGKSGLELNCSYFRTSKYRNGGESHEAGCA